MDVSERQNTDSKFSSAEEYSTLKPGATPEALRHEIDGVEVRTLFSAEEQERLVRETTAWFERQKERFEGDGINVKIPRNGTSPSTEVSDGPEEAGLPVSVMRVVNAIMLDTANDPTLGKRGAVVSIRRTGNSFTQPDNFKYHVDTSRYSTGPDGTIVRDPERSVDKYMVFLGRPGTLVQHGRMDPGLTQQEATASGEERAADPGVSISQLLPGMVYRVATGDLLHRTPNHDDGLLFEVSFNT
jgi:hypothetical protein